MVAPADRPLNDTPPIQDKFDRAAAAGAKAQQSASARAAGRRQTAEELSAQPLTRCAEPRPALSSDKLTIRLRHWSSGHDLRVFLRKKRAAGPECPRNRLD